MKRAGPVPWVQAPTLGSAWCWVPTFQRGSCGHGLFSPAPPSGLLVAAAPARTELEVGFLVPLRPQVERGVQVRITKTF